MPPVFMLAAKVSIHAPLARSNAVQGQRSLFTKCFNTCSSCEEQLFGGACEAVDAVVSIHAPLARSNLALNQDHLSYPEVSIHAPLARSNTTARRLLPRGHVSIHAPLARSNRRCKMRLQRFARFQYMLLLRGATEKNVPRSPRIRFNTCSSCEEQLLLKCLIPTTCLFQYMLLLRGATHSRLGIRSACLFQYMLLLRGATFMQKTVSLRKEGFNTCSSCEEQLKVSA